MQPFQDHLRYLMEIFLDDFYTFITKDDHLEYLGKYLDCCGYYRISLNLEKCQFGVPFHKLLRHIVSLLDITTNSKKVTRILTQLLDGCYYFRNLTLLSLSNQERNMPI